MSTVSVTRIISPTYEQPTNDNICTYSVTAFASKNNNYKNPGNRSQWSRCRDQWKKPKASLFTSNIK